MTNNNWYKIDNVSKVFLATRNSRDTRSLRVSCTLNEDIDEATLQTALINTIGERKLFQVRIRRGFFWHYLEQVDDLPKVIRESGRPCQELYGKGNRRLHYQVSYYKKRINIDMFHALTDGTGAIEFLNILVVNYLRLKHPEELKNLSVGGGASAAEISENSYSKFYDKNGQAAPSCGKAYHISGGKLPHDQLQFIKVDIPIKELLGEAKELGVGLTSLVGAKLMLAIAKDMPSLKRKMPVTISIPVNLRNFYESDTSRNFFNSVSVSHIFAGGETVEELAVEFNQKLKESLNPETVRRQMVNYQRIERILLLRMVPLFLKQPVVRHFAKKDAKNVSAVISNIGAIKVKKELEPYIKDYGLLCSHSGLYMSMCSFNGRLSFGITSGYNNTSVLRNFIRSFAGENVDINLEATEVIS